jgi:hypothetical protein
MIMWGFFASVSTWGGGVSSLAEKFRTEENKGAEVMNRLLRGAAAGLTLRHCETNAPTPANHKGSLSYPPPLSYCF